MSHSPRPPLIGRGITIAIVALLVPLAVSTTPATAQVDDSTVSLSLESQPVFHRPGDALGIRLEVTNNGTEPLDEFTLSVAVHSRVQSRSALHASFEGSSGLVIGSTSIPFEGEAIAPADRRSIPVDLSVDDLPNLQDQTEGGVYPLRFTFGVAGVPLDELTTSLIYYPEPPETPLNLVLVVPLNDIPSRNPEGIFEADLDDTPPVERAVGADGWLRGLVDGLTETAGELAPTIRRIERERRPNQRRRPPRIVEVPTPSVHLGLAVTPRFVEEIADLANGYRRAGEDGVEQVRSSEAVPAEAREVLTGITSLLEEEGVQSVTVPYSFPDVPALARSLSPDRTSLELSEGAEVLDGALSTQTGPEWLFAPAGRLDSASLSSLQRISGVEHSFFSPDALSDPPDVPAEGCPEAFASFTCAITVRTTEGSVDGFVSDAGLQDRLADLSHAGDDQLDIQRFFAETAAIRQEIPSVPGRVAQATIPSLWHPSPALSVALLEGLRTAPWLRTLTPAEALALPDLETRPRTLVAQIDPIVQEPLLDYFSEIEDVADSVSHFELVGPPAAIVQRMVRNTLVAQSRLWWTDSTLLARGGSYVETTREEVTGELSKITLGTPNEIRLTSRQGEVPLVVFNETDYPVRVDVRMLPQSLDLELDPSLLEDQPIQPQGTNQFTVKANARSSGIFPLEIRLETPDGYPISSKVVTVTSTKFNEVALGITIGAFSFLVLFYVTRAVRRRSRASA